MYAVSSSRTEQGIQFRAAMRRKQEQEQRASEAEAVANEKQARRLAIVNERRRAAAEAFECTRAMYREISRAPRIGKPPVRRIIMDVAKENGTTYEAIVGHDRTVSLIAVRFAAILRVKQTYPGMSKPELGRHFGGRDRTTILNALRKMGYYDGSARERQEGAA